MNRLHTALSNLALSNLALCSAGIAQTFTVDANLPIGSPFRDLPTAVAAVPNGATLHVMPGLYSPFSIASKSLTVFALDASATTFRAGDITVGPLASTESVRLEGLRVAPGNQSRLRLLNCAGSVSIDSWNPVFANSFIDVFDCASVHMSRIHSEVSVLGSAPQPTMNIRNSRVEIFDGDLRGGGTNLAQFPGSAAMHVDAGSHVTMHACTVTGGHGTPFGSPGGNGGPALVIDGGSFVESSCSIFVHHRHITGGSGGSTNTTQGGNGGPGAILRNSSLLLVHGHQLRPGIGGFGNGSQNNGVSGPRDIVDPTSTVVTGGVPRPIAVLIAPFTPGGQGQVDFTAADYTGPPTPAVVLIGIIPRYQSVPFLATGVLGVDPFVTIGPLFAAAGNWQSAQLAVPAGFPSDFPLAAQVVSLHPQQNELMASNTIVTTTR